MAYQALARKWRPRNFTEVVGQEHVVRALTHALESGRMHHAYLFAGTRGVGKTTLARLLAKALNCENRQGTNPCGGCQNCTEVDTGRFIDLIEVDAASRTKVEDTRELLENVQYAPGKGRFKVYLIDEVHMLSGHSFNALLKTLEEPPPHVKFLLATTDPQKIPVTVLSRCLQFNLKRLAPEQIRAQMQRILALENIGFEAGALRALARAAQGSMRDGLSLLDQAIAHCGGDLSEAGVSVMLGTVAREPVFGLLDALAAADASQLLDASAKLAEFAPDYGDVLQQILAVLHHVAIAQWYPKAVTNEEEGERILALARRLSPEDTQLYYQIGLLGQRDLPLAPDPRDGFEMILLRMLAFRPAAIEAVTTIPSPPPIPAGAAGPWDAPWDARGIPDGNDRGSATPPRRNGHTDADPGKLDWSQMIRSMNLTGMTRQLASHCVLRKISDQVCELWLDRQQAQIRAPQIESNLERSLQQYFGRPLKLVIHTDTLQDDTPAIVEKRVQDERQRLAELEIETDETVRAFQDLFDARVLSGSTRPIDPN
jgi:DNA polymerase-3 subunit gamma/tau